MIESTIFLIPTIIFSSMGVSLPRSRHFLGKIRKATLETVKILLPLNAETSKRKLYVSIEQGLLTPSGWRVSNNMDTKELAKWQQLSIIYSGWMPQPTSYQTLCTRKWLSSTL